MPKQSGNFLIWPPAQRNLARNAHVRSRRARHGSGGGVVGGLRQKGHKEGDEDLEREKKNLLSGLCPLATQTRFAGHGPTSASRGYRGSRNADEMSPARRGTGMTAEGSSVEISACVSLSEKNSASGVLGKVCFRIASLRSLPSWTPSALRANYYSTDKRLVGRASRRSQTSDPDELLLMSIASISPDSLRKSPPGASFDFPRKCPRSFRCCPRAPPRDPPDFPLGDPNLPSLARARRRLHALTCSGILWFRKNTIAISA